MNNVNDTTSNAADPQYQFGFVETLAGGSGENSPWYAPEGYHSSEVPPFEGDDYYGGPDDLDVDDGLVGKISAELSFEERASYIFMILTQNFNSFQNLLGRNKMEALADHFFYRYLGVDLDELDHEYNNED